MKEKTAYNKRFILVLAVTLLISVFFYFQFIVPYHVFFKEQIQLFIFHSTYVLSYFSKPGALACLTGDFLTQFFYLKGGGSVVISLLFVFQWLMIVLILNSFDLRRLAPVWAFIPVFAEWVVFSGINFSVAMSVSFFLILFAIFVYTRIINKSLSLVYGLLSVPFLYMLLGSTMFLLPVAIMLFEIRCGKKRYIYWLILIALAVIIPFLLRSYYLITFNQAYLYPHLDIRHKISSLLMILILFFANMEVINKLRVTALSLSFILFFVFISGVVVLIAKTDFKQEKILGMATEAYFENWDKVLKISEKTKLESTIAAYYTNIALSKKMQLGDRMMEFYQPFTSGLFLPVNQESNWFTIFFSSDIFYYIGDLNMAQHSAMLGMIFSPYQRSSRLIQRLAEINIIAGDTAAAIKYIKMLESSAFHSDKAVELKKMALSTDSEELPSLKHKRSQIHKSDTLRTSENLLLSLELLLYDNHGNHAALDYLLSYHLMNKDIPGFFNAYSSYCKGKTNYVPKVYAEALLIYFAASNSQPEKIMEFNISPKFVKDFNDYTQLYESSNGNLEVLQGKFPDTYWLFYHFATRLN